MGTAMVSEAVVVDASVIAEYLLPGPRVEAVAPLFRGKTRSQCWAPDLSVVEVANALRNNHRREPGFTLDDVYRGTSAVFSIVAALVRVDHLIRAAVAHLDALTSYDAVYLALAEARSAPLCTLDVSQANAALEAGIEVLVPGTQSFTAWIEELRG